jgi:hypothetical protein
MIELLIPKLCGTSLSRRVAHQIGLSVSRKYFPGGDNAERRGVGLSGANDANAVILCVAN